MVLLSIEIKMQKKTKNIFMLKKFGAAFGGRDWEATSQNPARTKHVPLMLDPAFFEGGVWGTRLQML
jgi:hypothetical protein